MSLSMRAPILGLALLGLLAGWAPASAGTVAAADFAWMESAAPGPARSVGAPAAGCLAGAARLPEEGPGWMAVRIERNRLWGHPRLVAFVESLAAEGARRGLPPLLVGDLGQPRGGPMPSGHRSHQTGLDVDLMFEGPPAGAFDAAARASFEPRPATRADGTADPARFGTLQMAWLHLAASSPEVDRIFVNFRLKKALCDAAGAPRDWLRKIRPWVGHQAHFHVRLACTPGDASCGSAGAPIPEGDGCGAELDSWLASPPAAGPPPRAIPLPEACAAVLSAP